MKNILLILIIALSFASCKPEKPIEISLPPLRNNAELQGIYDKDQGERLVDEIDWPTVNINDSLRRIRVHQLLDSNLVRTSKDYENAAMVFQHGRDTTHYGMAVRLIKKAIEMDSTTNKWLFAAATDRYLLSKGEPQIFGTQYQKMGDEPWKLGEIDTTIVSDAERIKYGVETLAEQQEKVKKMNSDNETN